MVDPLDMYTGMYSSQDENPMDSILSMAVRTPSGALVVPKSAKKKSLADQNKEAISKVAMSMEEPNVPSDNPAAPYQKPEAPSYLNLTQPSVPQAPKDSGMKYESGVSNKNTLSDEDLNKTVNELANKKYNELLKKSVNTSSIYQTPEELADQRKRLLSSGAFDDQVYGLMASRNRIDAPYPQDTVSGGLIGLLRSWGKDTSGFEKGRGMNPDEYRKNIMDYQAKLQDDTRDLSKSITEAAKGLKVGTNQNTLSDILKNAQEQKQLEQNQNAIKELTEGSVKKDTTSEDPSLAAKSPQNTEDKNYRDWFHQFNKDIVGSNHAMSEMAQAVQLLKNKSSVSDADVKLKIVKALTGSARITNQELSNTAGASDWADRAKQLAETIDSGQMTDINRGQFLNLAASMLDQMQKMRDGLKEYHRGVGIEGYHLPSQRINSTVNGSDKAVQSLPSSSSINTEANKFNPAMPSGRIRVKKIGTSETGTVLEKDFDPKKYERIK